MGTRADPKKRMIAMEIQGFGVKADGYGNQTMQAIQQAEECLRRRYGGSYLRVALSTWTPNPGPAYGGGFGFV